jgi:hypothetical protein
MVARSTVPTEEHRAHLSNCVAMSTVYLAYIGEGELGAEMHLVREDAEASLCGLPRSSLSAKGVIEDIPVCRDCVDWTAKRWTGTFKRVPA